MNVVAKFEKVSFEQFKKDVIKYSNKYTWSDLDILKMYNAIKLPKRSTSGSAGYDIRAPYALTVVHGRARVIPTGIRCRIADGWFLDVNPRNGQGFKYGIRLANTRGIIDSDYYNADNEGHILIKVVHDSKVTNEPYVIKQGQRFVQGIFTMYGITEDDDVVKTRTGGFGSTD